MILYDTNPLRDRHEGRGMFTVSDKRNVIEDRRLDSWEKRNKEGLQKLVRLIEMVIERLVSSSSKQQAVVVKRGSSELEFYSLSMQYPFALPPTSEQNDQHSHLLDTLVAAMGHRIHS